MWQKRCYTTAFHDVLLARLLRLHIKDAIYAFFQYIGVQLSEVALVQPRR